MQAMIARSFVRTNRPNYRRPEAKTVAEG